MLALSDQQLALVMQAAALLPPPRRDDFMRSVASRLSDIARPSDHELGDAVQFILSTRGVSAPFLGQRRIGTRRG